MWNAAIPIGGVQFDADDQEATLNVKNVLVFDGFTVPNSLNTFHPLGHAHAVINSLKMKWSITTNKRSVNDCADAFRGDFFENTATIAVTATTPPAPARTCPPAPARNGFRFVSDPASTSVSHFAQIGRERNGVYF